MPTPGRARPAGAPGRNFSGSSTENRAQQAEIRADDLYEAHRLQEHGFRCRIVGYERFPGQPDTLFGCNPEADFLVTRCQTKHFQGSAAEVMAFDRIEDMANAGCKAALKSTRDGLEQHGAEHAVDAETVTGWTQGIT